MWHLKESLFSYILYTFVPAKVSIMDYFPMSQLKIRYNSYICPYLYPIFLKRRIENIKNRKKDYGAIRQNGC
ncbi:hypothetical protein M072_1936 [Bacteroides fragilis str. DS-208]|nr:hypothetical protein M072_1936 [Bacteroides fragilis str. DS-208]